MISKIHVITWLAALLVTIFISILWHVILFEQAFLSLGVYTRMDNPIYGFGLTAWLLESTAFVVLYFKSSWSGKGVRAALAFSLLMGAFTAAASLMGSAAKVDIVSISSWFALAGGFILVHFTLMGLTVGALNRRRS
jgi:hypothetical protein